MTENKIAEAFADPGAEYRGKPFWSWNGELRREELVRQAHIMKEMGLGGFFMHSRSGLITEYLGDEWFQRINEVADAAEKIGMEAWLYDEDRWPSGSAGGKATIDPKYRMKSLYVFESAPGKTDWDDQSFALYVARLNGINLYTYKEIDVTGISCHEDAARALQTAAEELETVVGNKEPGEWKALRFAVVPDSPASVYNGTTYIDTMSKAATERFIELTHEQYAVHCGDRLGRSIKGIFTDEPHRGHCFDNRSERDGVVSCATAWTDDIFDEFERRYGFACRPILPELFYRKNAELVAPVKLLYIDLADALFLERFAKPINDWCIARGMIFTGHVLHEDSLMNQTVPHGSLMRFYEYMGYPGVDVLTEHNRCYWIVKQLSSAARQLGKKWMLSELYGVTGWQFSFKGHKNVGDWQALFGINLRCQHLSWYTMEGEAKRDYPASILHQSPWYPDYKTVEDHFARMGVVLSEGCPDCDVLVLNPIESVWCQAYAGWASSLWNDSDDVEPYEERYRMLFRFLSEHQIDFDYGEEEMMSRLASAEKTEHGAVLRVGKTEYSVVVVANMLTIRPTTLSLLKDFEAMGGAVIFCGDAPQYVNAFRSEEPRALASRCIRIPFDETDLVDAIRNVSGTFVSVENADGSPEKSVFAQVRKSFGGHGAAVTVLNTDRETARPDLVLSLRAQPGLHAQEWDLDSGARYDASAITEYRDGRYIIRFSLDVGGTKCFVLAQEADDCLRQREAYETIGKKTLTGRFPFRRDEPNVCVLDHCRWRKENGVWSDEEEVLRIDRRIRSEFGLPFRGGDMLQPWYAKLHDRKIYGKVQLSYTFEIDRMPSDPVFLAAERPELNHYKINGVELFCGDINDFWVDDCFKKMPIPPEALKPGKNEITAEPSFMRTTNVEALYLLGDFGVRIDGCKAALTGLPALMGCDNYADYAMPFYTGNLTYLLSAQYYLPLIGDMCCDGDRVMLVTESFTGACVRVFASGKTTVCGWEPFEADVTQAIRQKLPIEVTVVGTRINVFGPLHEIPKPEGACGPGNFLTEGEHWTDDYSLLDSGLRGFTFKIQKRIN